MNGRRIEILERIAKADEINVAHLASEFGVSQPTIRTDLKVLEAEGMLQRFHGGARAVSNDDIMKRMSFHFEEKRKIAQAAASLVHDGETVLIESGSANALLAKELTAKTGITVITNSAFIARYVRGENTLAVVLLGGDYQKESEVMVGPLARMCAAQFHADKIFVGADGFSPETGFTCLNLQRAETARAMAAQANQTIILTDASKFSNVGVTRLFSPGEVDRVITDEAIHKKDLNFLRSSGIEVLVAE